MFLTNTEVIPGKTITICHGVVSGSMVRAKHAGRDLMAGIKNIFGGELKGYTELLGESRDEAIERMKSQARQMGANAIYLNNLTETMGFQSKGVIELTY
jgi:uncharacterized protein YbjQ (UPF0145 family)